MSSTTGLDSVNDLYQESLQETSNGSHRQDTTAETTLSKCVLYSLTSFPQLRFVSISIFRPLDNLQPTQTFSLTSCSRNTGDGPQFGDKYADPVCGAGGAVTRCSSNLGEEYDKTFKSYIFNEVNNSQVINKFQTSSRHKR